MRFAAVFVYSMRLSPLHDAAGQNNLSFQHGFEGGDHSSMMCQFVTELRAIQLGAEEGPYGAEAQCSLCRSVGGCNNAGPQNIWPAMAHYHRHGAGALHYGIRVPWSMDRHLYRACASLSHLGLLRGRWHALRCYDGWIDGCLYTMLSWGANAGNSRVSRFVQLRNMHVVPLSLNIELNVHVHEGHGLRLSFASYNFLGLAASQHKS